MSETQLAQVAALCRQAAETLDHHGSFRLRVLMQMLLLELEKEQAGGNSAEQLVEDAAGPAAPRG